jgi:CheY-like chemotaxis protein
MKKKTVLLIEDNKDDIAFAKRAIKRNGHNINLLSATDGQMALDLLFHKGTGTNQNISSIDLILLDINIPMINGLEVLRIIREKFFLTHYLLLFSPHLITKMISWYPKNMGLIVMYKNL